MIRISALAHKYAKEQELSFRDWTIGQGEHWLMLGGSGSGKTTLLHIMAGLLKPSSGAITIDQVEVNKLSGSEVDRFRGRHVGLVFQRPHLIKSLNVTENLLLAQTAAGLKPNTARISDVLASLHIAGKKNSYPTQLSQGQMQRVAIARAVVNRPAVLMADEPTSSLDDDNTLAVLDLLTGQAKENGATLVIATHDQRVKSKLSKSYEL